MIKLIQNELMKIFSKASGWGYLIAVVVVTLGIGLIYSTFQEATEGDWRESAEMELAALEMEREQAPEEEKEFYDDQIAQLQSNLENDIDVNATSNWHFMNDVVISVTSLVTLFVVIVSSANVSAEFSDGTIKQLLIRPHSRWSILLSKYIASLIYALLMLIVLVAAGYLIGLLLFGSGDFSQKINEWSLDGQIIAVVGEQFFLKMAYYIPGLIVLMTISFMLSTLFKSQALAVGIGVFFLFASTTLGGIILVLAGEYAWAKLLIFPYLDLTIFATQSEILEGVTFAGALGILGAYYIIFMVLTFMFFQKRDISI